MPWEPLSIPKGKSRGSFDQESSLNISLIETKESFNSISKGLKINGGGETMSNTLKTDRREHTRLELTNLVAYKNFCIEEVTETINISMGGMKIKTEFPIDQNAPLDVALRIGKEEFKSEAKVVYCNPREDRAYEVGLRFERTSQEHLTLLNHYLNSQNHSLLTSISEGQPGDREVS